jgi:hypothetical protein
MLVVGLDGAEDGCESSPHTTLFCLSCICLFVKKLFRSGLVLGLDGIGIRIGLDWHGLLGIPEAPRTSVRCGGLLVLGNQYWGLGLEDCIGFCHGILCSYCTLCSLLFQFLVRGL